jgi:uncharacterized circularly permuted ATP-grasp superfamily protein
MANPGDVVPRDARPGDRRSRTPLFEGYEALAGAFDEYYGRGSQPLPPVAPIVSEFDRLGREEFVRRQKLADATFLRSGVTFSVYSEQGGTERIFPFDLIPRVVSQQEWVSVETGLVQRIQALNAFLNDVYGEQAILDEGVVPRELVEGSAAYRPKMRGIRPPQGVYIHIGGIDLIRDAEGTFTVLEDNVRTPSGVSYVLENRMMMKKVFPRIFRKARVRGVEMYATKLREAMTAVSPAPNGSRSAVLTPGPFNSAYFEHSFLARNMGLELVQGSDLFVEKDCVYAKTTRGADRIDVLYRRIDDDFIDPEVFRKDSLLGVPGLVRAYAAGNVALVNAIGNGVADDKGIYPYVPDMIRFYLSEEPILAQVRTYICAREKDRRYVLDHIGELVVKAVNEAGGYGMLVGPKSSRAERREFVKRISERPRNYIAQPLIELSGCPTWTRGGIAPRRVDLRPFVVTGSSSWVLPGGLTRVALVEGSYVVNSSQGGGSKDTWVAGAVDPR